MINDIGAFNWKVEAIVSKGDYNYARVPGHPNASAKGYVLHHRVIIELTLKRYLLPSEVVHHINGNKKDNRPENLEVTTLSDHSRHHGFEQGKTYAQLKCPGCDKIFIKPLNNTHIIKGGLTSACSRKCRGKFSNKIQRSRLTNEVQMAISENLVRVFKRFPDNSEETIDIGSVETIRHPSEMMKI